MMINFFDYSKLAFRSLKERRLRSWLTMIGIFIGIASVISLIGLGEGLRTAITSQFGFLGTDVLSVQATGLTFGPPGSGVITPLKDDLAQKISKISGVETAFNRYLETGVMEFNDRQRIIFSASIPGGEDRKIFEKMVNLKVESGRLLKDVDRGKIILGNDYSKSASFGRAIKTGDRIIFKEKTFEVAGILEKKGSFIFDSSMLLNEDDLLELSSQKDTTDIIAVKVREEGLVEAVRESIEKLMLKERDVKKGEEDFIVESPQNILETLDSSIFAVQLFVLLIAGISIIVGGIGIMNTMYTSVLERTKEIGIMKAIGARNSTIFIVFSIESGFLGMVGGIIGIIIGLILAYGLAFIGQLFLGSDLIRATITVYHIISALLFSFIMGTVSGVFPALRAAKLHPVDSLRFK